MRLALKVVWIVTMKRGLRQHEKISGWLSNSFFYTALFSISTQNRTQVKGYLLILAQFLKRMRLMQSCCLYIHHLTHTLNSSLLIHFLISHLILKSWRNQIPYFLCWGKEKISVALYGKQAQIGALTETKAVIIQPFIHSGGQHLVHQ